MTVSRPGSQANPQPSGLESFAGVALRWQLIAAGIKTQVISAQLENLNWRAIGPAIVLHYGPLDCEQQRRLAMYGHRGPAVLASFTALQAYGLTGWEQPEIHVLVEAGTTPFQHPELPPIILHTATRVPRPTRGDLEPVTAAAIRAAASCPTQRQAGGVLAAVIGQGVVQHWSLRQALSHSSSTTHHAAMLTAVADIGQGHDALTDLDLGELCTRHGIAPPLRQRRLTDPAGRRRMLEAVWELPDGRPLVVEVDCALHKAARRWWEPQLRPSDLVPCANGVMRIPSAVVRYEPAILLDWLRQKLA